MGMEKAAYPFENKRLFSQAICDFQGVALNRKSAFPRVLSYQNSFLGSKFVVIGGSLCQKMRRNALFHKVLRVLTKYFSELVLYRNSFCRTGMQERIGSFKVYFH